MPAWLEVQRSKAVFFLTLYFIINDMKLFLTVGITLICATAIFVVDCCRYGPSWMFGPKMDLMACAGLVGGTMEQSCLFPDLKC